MNNILFYIHIIINYFLDKELSSDKLQSNNKLYKIKKPWNDCLNINKIKWKEQAARGINKFK